MNKLMNILEYNKLYSFSLGPAAGPADGGSRPAGHPRSGPEVGWVLMASMDISLTPCMPGAILPPSWSAYKRVLCDSGVIMFFRKDPPQTEGRRDVWKTEEATQFIIADLLSHRCHEVISVRPGSCGA